MIFARPVVCTKETLTSVKTTTCEKGVWGSSEVTLPETTLPETNIAPENGWS